jgi:hypothetical protein
MMSLLDKHKYKREQEENGKSPYHNTEYLLFGNDPTDIKIRGEPSWPEQVSIAIIFQKCSVRFSVETLVILADFSVHPKANVGIVLRLGHDHFFSHPFQFIVH